MGMRTFSIRLWNRLNRLQGTTRSRRAASHAVPQEPERLERRYCLSSFTVVATGLEGPRGLTFGSDGALYVAEAGLGGTTVATGQQVPTPIGPYSGGPTGRISKVNVEHHTRTTVASKLPSTVNQFGDFQGVTAVTFSGGKLYALVTGGGASHGNPSLPNGVYRIDSSGKAHLFANLSYFERHHPVQNPDPGDFEPDGAFYAMVNAAGHLYVTSANHQELLRIGSNGDVTRVKDFSKFFDPALGDWRGPTGLAYHDGRFYIGTLGEFPIDPKSQIIEKVSPSGAVQKYAHGLTAVLGVEFHGNTLYALETSTVAGNPTPGTGKVVKLTSSGKLETVASGLSNPTAMTFGPDGKLYVSDFGFGTTTGEIVRIAV